MISHQIKTGFYHKSDRKWEKNYPFIIGKPNSIGNRRNWIGKQIVHVYLAISSSYPFWFCGIPIDLFMQKWSVLLKEKEKSWMTTVAERLSRHLMQSNDRWKLCSLSKFAIMHSPSFGSVFLLVSHSLFDQFRVSHSLFDQFRGEVPEHCVVSLVISWLPANLKPLFCIKRYQRSLV